MTTMKTPALICSDSDRSCLSFFLASFFLLGVFGLVWFALFCSMLCLVEKETGGKLHLFPFKIQIFCDKDCVHVRRILVLRQRPGGSQSRRRGRDLPEEQRNRV